MKTLQCECPVFAKRLSLVFALCVVSVPGITRAQDSLEFDQSFSIQAFEPAPGPDALLTIESVRASPRFAISAGLLIDYQRDPLAVYSCRSGTGGAGQPECELDTSTAMSLVISDHLQADLWVAIGFLRMFQVALAAPVVLYQGGEGMLQREENELVAVSPNGTTSIGDLRLHLKWSIPFGLGRGDETGFGLAIAPVLTFPTGNAAVSDAFMGDGTVTVHPQLLGEYRRGGLQIGARLGYRWRETSQIYSTELGDHLSFGAGASYTFELPNVTGLRLRPILEVFGTNSFSPLTTLEIDMALQALLNHGFAVTLGGGAGLISAPAVPQGRVFLGVSWSRTVVDTDGDGIYDRSDACPTDPEDQDGFEDRDGCPDPDNDQDGILDEPDECPNDPEDIDEFEDENGCPDPDNDQDGILDGPDECPNDPEDMDEFEDENGCPDPDNDQDGILDEPDECPNIPENMNNYEDEDGCPESLPPEPEDESLPSIGNVMFAVDSDEIIGQQSIDLMNELLTILRERPDVRARLEGHADSRGTREYNINLSQSRAERVRDFLIENGIETERLSIRFYGYDRPLVANNTETGRTTNRRVEIRLIEPATE